MIRISNNSKTLNIVLVAFLLTLEFHLPSAQAGMIGTEKVIQSDDINNSHVLNGNISEDRKYITNTLIQYGIDPEIAQYRTDALSDSEVQELALRIETLPAGGNSYYDHWKGGYLNTVFIIFLMISITDFICLTDVVFHLSWCK